MSLLPLENPLTRLTLFPNTMNYRGGWSATELYYANDVIVDSLDNNTYILTGKTTLLGGGDPSTNTDWEVLSSTTGSQVLTVTADPPTGVQNTGNATDVELINTGIISVTTNALDGIQNVGDAQNQELESTGIVSVISDIGTGIDNTNTPQNPVLVNTGVITIVGQNGCVVSGTPSNRIIETTGIVLSCAAKPVPANGGVVVDGTLQNPTFSWAPLATGIASLVGPTETSVLVTVPYNLTENSFIMLNFVSTIPNPGTLFVTNSTWWRLTLIPTVFELVVASGVGGKDVRWTLLSL